MMTCDLLAHAQSLSDQDLLMQVKTLAQEERRATVALVAHLAVLDERRLYLDEGFSSLFSYCTEALHLSEHAAYGRIETARAVRRFPILLEMLADGALTVTTVGLLSAHLTPANCAELLGAARHRSKRQVEELIACLHPLDTVPSTIRKLPQPRSCENGTDAPSQTLGLSTSGESSRLSGSATLGGADTPPFTEPPPPPHGSPPLDAPPLDGLPHFDGPPPRSPSTRPDVVAPLGLHRYRVQFTMSAHTHEKLRLARDLLSHQVPSGDLGEIFERALTVLIETLAREKFAATDRPRTRPASRGDDPACTSRHIPAKVKRAVWLRDGGRCAFIAKSGRRCTERRFLEFHHIEPYGAGGEASVDNIELRCRAHNLREAALFFGDARLGNARIQEVMAGDSGVMAAEDRDGRSPGSDPHRHAMTSSARAGPG